MFAGSFFQLLSLGVLLVYNVHTQLYICSYLIKMPLGQQNGTHSLGALVVRGSVFILVSIPPAGLSPPPSSVSVGASSAHLVRSKRTSGSSTHFTADTAA